jgi:drug/metabolite transporter (DMT)-like permease
MDRSTQGAALAALVILVLFGLGAYFMPAIMLALGEFSTLAAGSVAILFVAAFFAVFWLRARWRRGPE